MPELLKTSEESTAIKDILLALGVYTGFIGIGICAISIAATYLSLLLQIYG